MDTVSFSTTAPTIGSKLNATITGSDPEHGAIGLEWTWSDVSKRVARTGTTLSLSGLKIADSAQAGDKYGISLKLTDALGAYVTHKQNVGAVKPEPPQITSFSIPGAVWESQGFSVHVKGNDPDGSNKKLSWSFGSSNQAHLRSVRDNSGSSGKADYINRTGWGSPSVRVTLTDAQGLSVSTTKSYRAMRQSSGGSNSDPLVFDLNGDGEIGITANCPQCNEYTC